MKIVSIFGTPKCGLFSVQFSDDCPDEFTALFRRWNNPEFLEEFFETNADDLLSGFFGEITIEDAIVKTYEDASYLEKRLLDIAQRRNNQPSSSFDLLFEPLDINECGKDLAKSKGKGKFPKSWLRIYAIRIDGNLYVVTGGTIKLTQTMDERAHTRDELQKLRRVHDYLIEEGIIGCESFYELDI